MLANDYSYRKKNKKIKKKVKTHFYNKLNKIIEFKTKDLVKKRKMNFSQTLPSNLVNTHQHAAFVIGLHK